MQRTPLLRKSGLSHTETAAKVCAYEKCKKQFYPHPSRPLANVCSPRCATRRAEAAVKARQAAEKEQRKQDKAKLEAMKTIADFIREAQTAFNSWVRERDKDQPCICCGRTKTTVEGLGAHGWDAGHYRSTGSASHLRFNPDNAHRQLVLCNRHGAGRAVDYRIGLIGRIGLERVEALESSNEPHKWQRDELIAIKLDYRAKLKALKKDRQ